LSDVSALPTVGVLPRRLQLEVTNRCALGCTSCARHHWDPAANPIGDITPDVLDQAAPLLDAAIEVTLGGYGDPTESPMLLPALKRAKDAGCSVRLITGGAKLTPKLISELADGGLDRLVLSMDGARDATLKELRGVPLKAWLKWIRAAKAAQQHGFRPQIQLNVVVQWANVGELVELVELADREGVAGIHAFHLKSYTPDTADRCLLSDPDRARPHFDAARQRARQLGVFLHLPSLDAADAACFQPFEHLFVRHDGQVRGCCSGLFEPADFGLLAGRLEDGAEELWAADPLVQFRRASAGDGPFPAPCENCSFRTPTLDAHLRPLRVLRSA
jgi:MoaA/NifB/PqqE/SkfB family radical SAM enzyme